MLNSSKSLNKSAVVGEQGLKSQSCKKNIPLVLSHLIFLSYTNVDIHVLYKNINLGKFHVKG